MLVVDFTKDKLREDKRVCQRTICELRNEFFGGIVSLWYKGEYEVLFMRLCKTMCEVERCCDGDKSDFWGLSGSNFEVLVTEQEE